MLNKMNFEGTIDIHSFFSAFFIVVKLQDVIINKNDTDVGKDGVCILSKLLG